MSSINFATREITCKIVYYGPGLSGKTTNLQVIHQKIPREKKTEMLSLATEGDRTLFFDFLPLNLGNIKGFKTKFQLYTVPGQVYYNSTRKLVLRGVDGVVFVADSQKSRQAENLDSLQNLRQNLQEYGLDVNELPLILQYNKRDMDNIFSLEEMDALLNPKGLQWFPATAHNGKGVIATLKAVSRVVIENFNMKQGMLRKAAAKVKNEGVHDVTLGGINGVTVAPSSQPTKSKEGQTVLSDKSELESAPESDSPFSKTPPASFSFKSPSGETNSPFSNPFESPAKSPSVGSKKESLFSDDEPEEDEIELRPYVPKGKNQDE
jgi:signal recognition particle receptor subunit beta